jgi:hypothetical protein|tara:strand:- start:228 stop:455 length:228 start_codon:yes stop_codon:yes gene_type:complete
MTEQSHFPREGVYRSSDGAIFSVSNVRKVDESFVLFDLVESDDPEDMDAIATELTGDDWEEVSRELSLTFVRDFE